MAGCILRSKKNRSEIKKGSSSLSVINSDSSVTKPGCDSYNYEKLFVKTGLVNICKLDSNLRVVLMYNSDKNFLGKNLYKGLNRCYLPCEFATKLNNAQKLLKQQFP